MRNVIYSGSVDALEGHDPFRDGECVALVQAVTNLGHTSSWQPGNGERSSAQGNPTADCDNADQFFVVVA
jgi:hypothetical protein